MILVVLEQVLVGLAGVALGPCRAAWTWAQGQLLALNFGSLCRKFEHLGV